MTRGVAIEVTERFAESRRTAVIAETTTWAAFPALWPELLDEVWRTVRANGLEAGRNVMLYRDDLPSVEVGVEIGAAFEPLGRVVCSELPAGRVATATHRGPYAELG